MKSAEPQSTHSENSQQSQNLDEEIMVFLQKFNKSQQMTWLLEDEYLTRSQLALYLGINRKTIYKWERKILLSGINLMKEEYLGKDIRPYSLDRFQRLLLIWIARKRFDVRIPRKEKTLTRLKLQLTKKIAIEKTMKRDLFERYWSEINKKRSK